MTQATKDPAAEIEAAERRATQARERLTDDLHKLQTKLNPKTLARDAARTAKDAGQSYARAGVDVAKQNPAPVAGAVAVTGLFLLRGRIGRLFRRKKKLTVPAQPKAPQPTYSDQGDLA